MNRINDDQEESTRHCDRNLWRAKASWLGTGWIPLIFWLGASSSSVAAPGEDNWSFTLSPYLWVANIEAETVLPSSPSGIDQFETSISAGAMLAGQVQYGSVGIFVDFAWLRLDTTAIDPGPAFSSVNLESDLIHATAALSYHLPLSGAWHAELLAGARLWDTSEEMEFKSGTAPGFTTEGGRTWVDPIVGGGITYDLSRRWSLAARGTVGGFGVSAEIAGEVFAGIHYRFTDWCSATLGYRYLYEKYDRSFKLELEAQGFLLGFGFHF